MPTFELRKVQRKISLGHHVSSPGTSETLDKVTLAARAISCAQTGDLRGVLESCKQWKQISRSPDIAGLVEKEQGLSLLHIAATCGHAHLLHALLHPLSEIKIPVNVKSFSGVTPLHMAAEVGQTFALSALLDAGADPFLRTDAGYTALHFAAKRNRVHIVGSLIDHAASQQDLSRPTHIAADQSRGMASALASIPNAKGMTPLMYAARLGHTDVVERLLQSDFCNTRAANAAGMSAVEQAVQCCSTTDAGGNDNRRRAAVLILQHLEAEDQILGPKKDSSGTSTVQIASRALQIAATQNDVRSCELLLQFKARSGYGARSCGCGASIAVENPEELPIITAIRGQFTSLVLLFTRQHLRPQNEGCATCWCSAANTRTPHRERTRHLSVTKIRKMTTERRILELKKLLADAHHVLKPIARTQRRRSRSQMLFSTIADADSEESEVVTVLKETLAEVEGSLQPLVAVSKCARPSFFAGKPSALVLPASGLTSKKPRSQTPMTPTTTVPTVRCSLLPADAVSGHNLLTFASLVHVVCIYVCACPAFALETTGLATCEGVCGCTILRPRVKFFFSRVSALLAHRFRERQLPTTTGTRVTGSRIPSII